MGLRIAVAGKGGSGKTTVSVLLAGVLAKRGRNVLLVDLDSDPNLAAALGLSHADAAPLVTRTALIAERTGSSGEPGGMFILNPRVADIVETHAVKVSDGISLLPVGTIEAAGEGCFCPQTAFVKALLGRLVLSRDECVILDLEAGLEAFGRSAAEGLDLLLIVIEAGMRSVDTARRILAMAPSTGIRNVRVVANKVGPASLAFLKGTLPREGIPIDIVLPQSDELARRDLEGRPILDYRDEGFAADAAAVLESLRAAPDQPPPPGAAGPPRRG